MTEAQHKAIEVPDAARRTVRSYVRREGRITPAQQDALDRLWRAYGIDQPGTPYDGQAWFGRAAPLVVEIGFGNGDHLADTAAAEPDKNFLGIEVHRPGVGRLLQRVEREGLTSVRAICSDAVEVLTDVLPAGSVSEVYVLFPDPWHKKRHHKRRIIQTPFAEVLARVLAQDGVLKLATDWADYAEHMRAVLDPMPQFENLAGAQGYMPRPEARQITRFEARGLRLGHAVFDLAYRRR